MIRPGDGCNSVLYCSFVRFSAAIILQLTTIVCRHIFCRLVFLRTFYV